MNILPEISFGTGAALLIAAVAISRSTIRKKRGQEDLGPIVPVSADENSDDTGNSHENELEKVYSTSSLTEAQEPTPAESATGFAPSTSSTVEQEYRGFKIRLNEKKPGLWIAIIMCPDGGKKKPQRKTAETWVTQEFYQVPAALADAKALIDERAYHKTGNVGETPEGTLRGMGSRTRTNEQLRIQH